MIKPILYIMVGLSASGKSTISKELASKNNCKIVSSDDIREEICENGVIDQSKNTEVFVIFNKRIKDYLKKGESVIADATNINIKSRKSILENIKNVDCYKIAYVIPKAVEDCIEDNIYRKHPVPHHVIKRQMMNFQIPFHNEGFDEIVIHRLDDVVDYNFVNNEFDKMIGFNQNNPFHNETLDMHCKKTTELFKEYNYDHIFTIASMLHDIGKLYTQTTDDEGISHYYQHENVGCYYLLNNINSVIGYTSLNDREFLDILFLINYHMLPMSWKDASDKTLNKWKTLFGEEKYNMLIDFNKCDKSR